MYKNIWFINNAKKYTFWKIQNYRSINMIYNIIETKEGVRDD